MVIPHCGNAQHSACRECTMQWYQKQSNESCMVCRIGKRSDKVNIILLFFVFGSMCSILTVLLMVLQEWVVLLLKVHTYAMFYMYFKRNPILMTRKELMVVFFVGFNITLYACIIMFIYLSYVLCIKIFYGIYKFVIMFANIHCVHLACTAFSIEETRLWLSIVNIVNKVASVSIFCFQVFAHC